MLTVTEMVGFVFVPCSDTRGRFFPPAVSLYMGPLCCCRHGDGAHRYHFPSACMHVCITYH